MSNVHSLFDGTSPGFLVAAIAVLGLASAWWAMFCMKSYRDDYLPSGAFLRLTWVVIWLAGEAVLLVFLFALSGNFLAPV